MIALITGSGGLVGSEAALHFASDHTIVGVDNDMRARYFGTSTAGRVEALRSALGDKYLHHDVDIRNRPRIDGLFVRYGEDIDLIIHAAAQPSHDLAAEIPHIDFEVNAVGTLNLLEAARQYAPEAVFIFVSTNKVYGDRPNRFQYEELETRYEPTTGNGTTYYPGFNEHMRIDRCLHSLFGASKLAADVLVQEYGRYFGMKTVCFRAGCLTGAAHAGAEQHGFLAYLMDCVLTGRKYTVYGYKGKQVRDNLHARDLARAFRAFYAQPRQGAVYNIGGGRANSVSVLEAIALCEKIAGRRLDYQLSDEARKGDHQWWITDNSLFNVHTNFAWKVEIGLEAILREMVEARVTA